MVSLIPTRLAEHVQCFGPHHKRNTHKRTLEAHGDTCTNTRHVAACRCAEPRNNADAGRDLERVGLLSVVLPTYEQNQTKRQRLNQHPKDRSRELAEYLVSVLRALNPQRALFQSTRSIGCNWCCAFADRMFSSYSARYYGVADLSLCMHAGQ
jgi:hypothetical protein